jgi:hypothetical protein
MAIQDIVSGNTAGYIEFFENLSGPRVEAPRWAAPRRLEVNGRPFRIMAGPNGSIQGPAEAKWGYTTLNIADWDGDGRLDIVYNSILRPGRMAAQYRNPPRPAARSTATDRGRMGGPPAAPSPGDGFVHVETSC